MTPVGGSYEIRSAAHGPHWIAWIVRAGSDQPDRPGSPDRAVVLVGETQEEAEARARLFAEQSSY